MRRILRLLNPVQVYSWGSRRAIAQLLGQPVPSPQPQAELWMGDHPQACSSALVEGAWVTLPELIGQFPEHLLGHAAARALPFLFKVLAAAEPLSIQAHPNTVQAQAGCAREDAAGIPRHALTRGYRDANAKPELLYALEPFWLLRGFRPPEEILSLAERFGLVQEFPACEELRGHDVSRALEGFSRAFMTLEAGAMAQLVNGVVDQARRQGPEDDLSRWICKLARRYPGDRGVLAPLFLHLVRLEPGQALYTGAGVLHAYLEGVGIELMANSDNVLRGGLTEKHVDVSELLAILRFEPQPPAVLDPQLGAAGEQTFQVAEAGLSLGKIRVWEEHEYLSSALVGAEILFCTQGTGVLEGGEPSERLVFSQGDALLVPATAGGYRIEGTAEVFRAAGEALNSPS